MKMSGCVAAVIVVAAIAIAGSIGAAVAITRVSTYKTIILAAFLCKYYATLIARLAGPIGSPGARIPFLLPFSAQKQTFMGLQEFCNTLELLRYLCIMQAKGAAPSPPVGPPSFDKVTQEYNQSVVDWSNVQQTSYPTSNINRASLHHLRLRC